MKLMRKLGAVLCLALALTIAVTTLPVVPGIVQSAQAATKLTATKKTLYVGKTFQLRMNKAGLKVKKWTSSKKTVATVTQKGEVTALKAGKTTITATVGSKKYTCVVTVKDPIVFNVETKLPKTLKQIHSTGEVTEKYKITKVRCTYTEDEDKSGLYRIDIQVAGKKIYDWLDKEDWADDEDKGGMPMITYKLYKGKKLVDQGTVFGPDDVYTGQSWSLKSSSSASKTERLYPYVFKPGTYTLKLSNRKQWN